MLQQKLKKDNIIFDFNTVHFKEKNVLIIDANLPEYNKDSGSRRLFAIIKILLKNDVGVFLMANQKEYKYNTEYVEFYQSQGVVVYQPSVDVNGKFISKDSFIKTLGSRIDFAWLHRPDVFYNCANLFGNNTKLIFDMVDFHYIRLLREWERNQTEKLRNEVDKYLKIELENCKKADYILAISETDKVLLSQFYKDLSKVRVLSNIHNYSGKSAVFKSFKDRENLLFVGSFRHNPNEDAVLYLRNEIMPIVWKNLPDLKVKIVGSYPTEVIKELNATNFEVVGFVEDISPYFENCRVFVAPLQFGAGIKGKIGQSLEYSLPLITTDIGAEGFNFGKFHDTMVGNTHEEIAAKIIKVYTNSEIWNNLSNYSQYILEPFSLNTTEETVLSIIK